jgi:hypothetical protein
MLVLTLFSFQWTVPLNKTFVILFCTDILEYIFAMQSFNVSFDRLRQGELQDVPQLLSQNSVVLMKPGVKLRGSMRTSLLHYWKDGSGRTNYEWNTHTIPGLWGMSLVTGGSLRKAKLWFSNSNSSVNSMSHTKVFFCPVYIYKYRISVVYKSTRLSCIYINTV